MDTFVENYDLLDQHVLNYLDTANDGQWLWITAVNQFIPLLRCLRTDDPDHKLRAEVLATLKLHEPLLE